MSLFSFYAWFLVVLVVEEREEHDRDKGEEEDKEGIEAREAGVGVGGIAENRRKKENKKEEAITIKKITIVWNRLKTRIKRNQMRNIRLKRSLLEEDKKELEEVREEEEARWSDGREGRRCRGVER